MGGAIYLQHDAILELVALIENNTAKNNGGGIAAVGATSIRIKDGTNIRFNSAGNHGGGIYCAGTPMKLGKIPSDLRCG